jgi:hypothetical protein
MLVNLAQGNLGILRQFMDTTGFPRFCHTEDLDRILTVENKTGETTTCSFHASWPTASNTRRARPTLAGGDDGGQANGATNAQERKRARDSTAESTQDIVGGEAARCRKSSKSDEQGVSRMITSCIDISTEERIRRGMYIAKKAESVQRAVTLTRRMTSLSSEHTVDPTTVHPFEG